MKITMNEFKERIENGDFKQTSLDISKDDLLQEDLWSINKASEQLKTDLAAGKLSQTMIHVVDAEFPIDFYLESDIINLPFDDAKKVIHFFEDGQEVETKVYLSTRCDYLNASKFHIDLISDGDVTDAQAKNAMAIMRANYETSLEMFNKKDEAEKEAK
ncbi:hypothetical protein [Companilactobacillus sp.]|jgi:hypothetical protein|uniref:hypothetical protein n=1 Tax=Companilactobacillus sp. TaxID=2767905 RepID=UPI0025BCBC1D|nr:hypothetical protein [Companilactobacillus sp.]MCH4009483.1 hypothetical protein [Companilactobacillus sp.]MCH4052841.1 hypothetical protein [Companilactobacillus sp.]MCH4077425.1 hypothetical protein [Companilactobacillus sp.]MCH4126001.1 hypothetical protein [Companilactobacillus sp.]MCI1311709.1 hypothetical protein [Companilactobacillus sp.]